jgi:transcriptional regulator with XRE-family HTH domain
MATRNRHTADHLHGFGREIRRLRLARNLSQEALAFEAGLDRTYVSGIERGLRNPTLSTMHRLAVALQIQLSRILAGVERSSRP